MEITNKDVSRIENTLQRLRTDGNNADMIASEFYLQEPEFFQALCNILLLKSMHREYTPYYLKRACIIDDATIITPFELTDFINTLIEFNTIESMCAEIYIAFHRALKKYLSFKKPRSSLALFIIKNTMTNFRDYIRGQYRFMNRLYHEISGVYNEEIIKSHYTSESYEDNFPVFDESSIMPILDGYILYQLYGRGIDIKETAKLLSLTMRQFKYRYENSTAELLAKVIYQE